MYQNLSQIERLASLTVGAGALAAGTRQREALVQIPLLMLGGALMFRGMSGQCGLYKALNLTTAKTQGLVPTGPVLVERAVTITKPVDEVFRFWRDLENLPQFMEHLVEVRQTSPFQSHWVAKKPLGGTLEWDAEIVEEVANEKIVWKSLPGSDIKHGGFVSFKPAPLGMGTEVFVRLQYEAPGGKLGSLVARLLGEEPGGTIRDDLRRLKALLETGEISTTEGQPVGGGKRA